MGELHKGFLVGKPERSRPLGRTVMYMKHNIKIYFNKIGWEGVEWINRAHDVDK